MPARPTEPRRADPRLAAGAGRRPASTRPRLALVVQYACPRRGLPHRRSIARWIAAALESSGRGAKAQVTVRFVARAEGRALNRRYRSKDYATNVLTFAYPPLTPGRMRAPRTDRSGGAVPTDDGLTGDIVLCPPVVQREAREQRKELSAHYAHLLIHGLLHLIGHDHADPNQARRMEQLEIGLLARLGYADPYR